MASSPELKSLSGLRGFAALGVVATHVSLAIRHVAPDQGFALGGGPYVDIFFALSGFILSYVYLEKMEHGTVSMGAFLRARVARIYPLYLLLVLAFLVLGIGYWLAFHDRPRWLTAASAWQQLVMVSALPVVGNGVVWNAPAWSVMIEWWVNLALFPLIVRFNRRLSLRTLVIGATVLVPLLAVSLVLQTGELQRGWPAWWRGGIGFYAGWVVFRLWRTDRYAPPPLVGDLGCLLTMLLIYLPVVGLSHYAWLAIVVIPFALLHVAHGRGLVSWLLSTRPMVYLGTISYSLYLVHVRVLKVLKDPHLYPHLGWAGFALATLACSVALSVVIYHVVEVPCRAYLRRRWT